MNGFGQDPAQMAAQAAQAACTAMGGQWNAEAMECQAGGQSYKVPDFQPDALPSTGCPSGQVQTPRGCFPYPGGVEPALPQNGKPAPAGACPSGTIFDGMADPPVCRDASGKVVSKAVEPSTKTETPAWVLPVVIGAGALALIAVVVTSK